MYSMISYEDFPSEQEKWLFCLSEFANIAKDIAQTQGCVNSQYLISMWYGYYGWMRPTSRVFCTSKT